MTPGTSVYSLSMTSSAVPDAAPIKTVASTLERSGAPARKSGESPRTLGMMALPSGVTTSLKTGSEKSNRITMPSWSSAIKVACWAMIPVAFSNRESAKAQRVYIENVMVEVCRLLHDDPQGRIQVFVNQ